MQSKARLWVAWDAEEKTVIGTVVTLIQSYPNGLREFQVWLVGGRDLKRWMKPGMLILEDYARAEGCAELTGGLRKGWLRLDPGFRETGITLAKRL